MCQLCPIEPQRANLVFLCLSVLELGPIYATDRRQTKASLNASALRNGGGGIIMGGATGGCGGQCPPLLGPAGYRGRSYENDLCFYSRQSLLQETEISTPLTLVVDTCQVNDYLNRRLGSCTRVSTVHPHWTVASVA